MYHHRWTLPGYSRGRKTGRYLPVQSCDLCGTTRNPLNRAIVYRAPGASSTCWSTVAPPDRPNEEQLVAWNRMLEAKLRELELAGETVARDYGEKPTWQTSFFDGGG